MAWYRDMVAKKANPARFIKEGRDAVCEPRRVSAEYCPTRPPRGYGGNLLCISAPGGTPCWRFWIAWCGYSMES